MSVSPLQYRLRTLLILSPAMLLLAGAAAELYGYYEVVQLGRTRKLPETMYGQHLGLAVALVAVAMIYLLILMRRDVPEAKP